MLFLPAKTLAEVLEHCRDAYPHEACGIIAGPAGQPTGTGAADRVIRITNVAVVKQVGFEFDQAEQLATYVDMDTRGEDPIVVYHSHPAGPAIPSPTDVQGAAGSSSRLLIVSMTHPDGDVRSWQIVDGQPVEEEIQVVDQHEHRPAASTQPR